MDVHDLNKLPTISIYDLPKISIAESNRRLSLLVAKLRTVPTSRFDMNIWVGYDWRGDPNLSCGTTACALGWATTIPEFRALGLVLARTMFSTVTIVIDGHHAVSHEWYLNQANSINAAMVFFGLSERDARGMFVSGKNLRSSATPDEVANHIERFMRDRA